MRSVDTIISRDSADLEVAIGSVKEAARIPLPPSLSLTSAISVRRTPSLSASPLSVSTEYIGKKSDFRDETHHVDAIDSMREGAEEMPEMPRSQSSVSVLSSKKSKDVDATVFKLSTSHSLTSNESHVSFQEVAPIDLPNSMSLSSHKSSQGGSIKGIPLALTKSRSTQSSKSAAASIKNTRSHATNSTMSMSRSTSNNSKVPVEMPVSQSNSMQSLEAVPKLSTSHSLTSKASHVSFQDGSESKAENDQAPIHLPNSMSLSSHKSSQGGSIKGIPLALTKSRSTQSSKSAAASIKNTRSHATNSTVSMSRSTSNNSKVPVEMPVSQSNIMQSLEAVPKLSASHSLTSKASHVSFQDGSGSKAGNDQAPIDLPNSMSLSSHKSSQGGSVEGIPLVLTKSRSTQSSKSASSKQAAAALITNTRSHATNSTVSMSRSTSNNSKVPVEMPVSQSNSVQSLEAVPKLSASHSLTSKVSFQEDWTKLDINEAVHTSSSNVSASSQSSKLITALEGNILWSIINGQTPKETDLDEETEVHPTVGISSSTKSPEKSAVADLPTRADAAVAKAEDETLCAKAEMESSFADYQSKSLKSSSSTITEVAENREKHQADDTIWDNSIEVSYSDMCNFMDMISPPAKEDPTDVEVIEVFSSISLDAAPTIARRKVRWSSKLKKKVFSGKSRKNIVTVNEKKKRSASLFHRFQKEKFDKGENEVNTKFTEPTEEGFCGEFTWTPQYDSIEKSFKYTEGEKNDFALNEPALQEASFETATFDSTALDNCAFCSKPEWEEAVCNIQEVKEAMYAVTSIWNTKFRTEEGWEIPKTRLDKEKAIGLFTAAKQLYSQRLLIEVKEAGLKEQNQIAHEAKDVASYQAALEKTGHLYKELSDAKRMESITFIKFKTLFNSLTAQERGYAMMLGDDVAGAANEVKALYCDADLKVELKVVSEM